MPVKVKCQSCEKIFAAPDAARGKMVKCPGCDEKVKVPAAAGAKSPTGAAKSAAKKKAAKASDEEHEDVLKNLDLDAVEDAEARVCPKCGADLQEEQTECSNCGYNIETGLTKEKQRGIDPKVFFRVVWKDSWAFLKQHVSFAVRTSVYTLVFTLLFLTCGFMVAWCVDFPPRMFWLGLTIYALMVPGGWTWFLCGEVIKATMDKREAMPRTNFDMYTSVALGVKTLLWTGAMSAQFILPLVGAFLIRSGTLIPGLVLVGIGLLFVFLTLPQAMVHMTMPLTLRGWLMHIHAQCWGKTFGAAAYWCVITSVAMLPTLIPVGVMTGIGNRGLGEFAGTFVYNYKANGALGADQAAAREAANAGKTVTEFKADDEKYKTKPWPWKTLIVPGIGLILSELMFGFGAVFAMRANGLFGLYYKKHLKLESMAKEIKWVSKKGSDDDDPATKKKRKQQELVKNIVGGVACLGIVGGVAWYLLRKPSDSSGGPAPDAGGQPAVAPADAVAPAGAAPAGQIPANPAGAAGIAIPM